MRMLGQTTLPYCGQCCNYHNRKDRVRNVRVFKRRERQQWKRSLSDN